MFHMVLMMVGWEAKRIYKSIYQGGLKGKFLVQKKFFNCNENKFSCVMWKGTSWWPSNIWLIFFSSLPGVKKALGKYGPANVEDTTESGATDSKDDDDIDLFGSDDEEVWHKLTYVCITA